MPVYLYWGADDFAIAQAVKKLQQRVLDPNWMQFNYQKLAGDQPENLIEGLNQAMTPVFGMGERLTWLVDTNLCQNKPSEDTMSELARTIQAIPLTSHLLLTTSKKPDGRLASTKLLKQHAQVTEFSPIPPWKTELIVTQVKSAAQEVGLRLTPQAINLLGDSVGNNTRQLWNELEKLKIYWQGQSQALGHEQVAELVLCNTQNSLKLAAAIKAGETGLALNLITALINRNEPALRIVATLVGQFRTWTLIKLMQQSGVRDKKEIAAAAGINNPNRLFFINKEIQQTSGEQLLAALPQLLELEYALKSGQDALATLQSKIVELCLLFQ